MKFGLLYACLAGFQVFVGVHNLLIGKPIYGATILALAVTLGLFAIVFAIVDRG